MSLRMLLHYYNDKGSFKEIFEHGHGATSVPAAEHSTITSWADVSLDSDPVEYEKVDHPKTTNFFHRVLVY